MVKNSEGKCKHGLRLGTCWTCKTGKRIEPENKYYKRRGDGLFHAMPVMQPSGSNMRRWEWVDNSLRRLSRNMGLDENKVAPVDK